MVEELKTDVKRALDGVECAGYREPARCTLVEQENGNVKVTGGASKSQYRKRQEIKREQLMALDEANIEWHYKEDGRFKNGYRVDTVIVTGKKELATDGGDRTSINVDKDSHEAAGDVKDEYGETWPEVLQWYAEHRPQENGEQSPADNINMDFSDIDTSKLPMDVPDDLQERLDRIESGVKEATNAAQSADRKLEDLGR